MNPCRKLSLFIRALSRKPELDADMDEEMRSHVEMQTQENIDLGMEPREARYAALRQFGWMESIKDTCREQRGVGRIEDLVRDIRFGVRMLLKAPGFTAVALLTLALGIGANTAIFSALDRLLVRPLPGVRDPQQLAVLAMPMRSGQMDYDFNYPLFCDYKRGNSVFSELAAAGNYSVGLGRDGVTERQQALLVSGNYFNMLGVNAAIGRTFSAGEGVETDDAPVVVLSHGLWLRRFGADPRVIGRNVTINGKPFTVIGVSPREFAGTNRGRAPDLYIPITMVGQLNDERPSGSNPLHTRYFTWHQILGRLRDGISHKQAQAAMRTLAQQIYAVTPTNTATDVAVLPGAQGLMQEVREARIPFHLLFATASLVLLIVCANLANLQLAKATARAREFAVRLALGAQRGRLIRQLLTESLILSLLGGGMGVLVAAWLTRILEHFNPSKGAFALTGSFDARVLWFAFGTSVLTGILFGLAPAWRASRPELVPELKAPGASETPARRWSLQSVLVVVQVALSLLVLVSAGLCVRSLQKLQRIDPGFEPSRLVLMTLDLRLNNYREVQEKVFYEQLLERVRAMPSVEAASLSEVTPLTGATQGMSISRAEDYTPAPDERLSADVNCVSPYYFRTLNVPILQGREFDTSDTGASLRTVVVDELLAQKFWPGESPLGKRLYLPRDEPPVEVVGVVGSMRIRNLSAAPRRTMYFPISQRAGTKLTLAVRTGFSPNAAIPLLRDTVRSLDPNVPLFNVRTMEQQLTGSLALERMAAALLSGFGILVLLLAALGIYGVLAYSVSQRTREIGIRMALGARISDVVISVMRHGARLTTVGMILGVFAAYASTRLLQGFLYDVAPLDPLSFAVGTILLSTVSLVACWLPARRAAQVNPLVALRNE